MVQNASSLNHIIGKTRNEVKNYINNRLMLVRIRQYHSELSPQEQYSGTRKVVFSKGWRRPRKEARKKTNEVLK